LSTDLRIGAELLGYRVEALLGRGGMSVVYRAEDLRLKRKVALKLLAPELAEDERFRERFLRESELAASLDHPHIVPIYDAGEVEGQLYIAMRYVEGTDLKSLLRREGPLEPKRALALLADLADALDAAHQRGLVHRDVKPSNALLDSAEHVYLADFGLTKSASDRSALTVTGRIIGTVDYAAPEQIEGKPVDGRADVYSLGCLLYECLSGEVPFLRDSELAVLWAHVNEPPPKLAAYPALDPVIARALAKNPAERYATCAELVEAARQALGLREVVVVRDRRPLLLAALGALVAAGALAAGLLLTLGGNGSSRQALVMRKNTLVRIDPKTNKPTAVIDVGRDPENVAYGGGLVWVYNYVDHTVEGIDAKTNHLAGTSAIVGAPPFVNYKNAIAADAAGAWVLSVDAHGGGMLTHIPRDFPTTQRFPLPESPVAVAVGAGWVWVTTSAVSGNALLRIDPRTGTVTGRVRVSSEAGAVLDWSAVGAGSVWLTDLGHLYRVDPRTMKISGRRAIECGYSCPTLAVGPRAVWLATNPARGGAQLLRIDPRSLRVTASLVPPGNSQQGSDVALDGGSVWWNEGEALDGVRRVDARTARIVSTIALIWSGVGIASVGPYAAVAGGGSLWVSLADGIS
jgi:DNA-binding beta-propeller fold protein YncE/tRNA A-37 threonylcarbamoyl transferase component Bud32